MEAIIGGLITGVFAFAGVLVTNNKKSALLEAEMKHIRTDIADLSDHVEKHNGVIERTYALEGRMNHVECDIKDIKRRD